MHANQDEVFSMSRDHASWQVAMGAMLAGAMVQGMRQYADLNIGMLRATLQQGNLAARQLVAAQDAKQFVSLAAAQVQPGMLRGLDYAYYLGSIAADMQGEMLRALTVTPDMKRSRMARSDGWQAMISMLNSLGENVFRFPVDAARAARLSLNLNAPVSESGRLRIAYTGPGRAAR